jgi:anti-sigma factor RsiW
MADFGHKINCRGIVEVVTDYLEDALSPAEVEVIDRHLAVCEGCRRYLAQMRITIATLGGLGDDDVPLELRTRLLDAFRELNAR